MLCKFAVRNFKSFNDWFSFNLSDVSGYDFNPQCIRDGVVNKALIYGHNGVGKSNLGLAIFDIVLHITDKFRSMQYYANYLNAQSPNAMAEFSYTFKLGNDFVNYEYGKVAPDSLVYERLSINDKKIIEYDRSVDPAARIDIAGTETLNKDLSQIKISIIKYIRSNAVIQDAPTETVLSAFFSFVDHMLLFWSLDTRTYLGYEVNATANILVDIVEKGHLEQFKGFLQSAGLDSNIKLVEENGEKKLVFDFGNRAVDFYSSCSTGMRSLTLFYYWLQRVKYANEKPSFIFIDEFDAFYHLSLSKTIIQELIGVESQVILTTHNTSLISNDLMRPDCYFLMYKDRIDPLSRLTDKELRFAHNIEKMYRAGAFGE